MFYQIKIKYDRGSEILCAEFDDLGKAESFINGEMAANLSLNIKASYRIYEGVDLVKEYSPEKNNLNTTQSSGSQGQTSTAGFRPTPFNKAPRPSGVPQKWEQDDEEKK
ncbi:MAG TPA: hypothetical protein VJN02_08475 [Gammaproteobacteria bacterium]|nr:hypothetical protein [Gammaproteobacteria bacterium]